MGPQTLELMDPPEILRTREKEAGLEFHPSSSVV